VRVNGMRVITNPVSNSNLEHNPYYTVPGKMGGMCVSHEHVEFFIDMMKGYSSYLEIGTFDGIALSLYAERYQDKHFSAVDSFEVGYATGGGHYEYFFENCKKSNNVDLWIGRSNIVLPRLISKGYSFDVIFVDGDHSYESIHSDYRYSWSLLNYGGRLVFHDIDLESTNRVLDELTISRNTLRHSTPVGVIYVEKLK